MPNLPVVPALGRRQFLRTSACGFGALALSVLGAERAAATPAGPLAPKAPHFKPRAKRVIFLFMAGGPSHLDLFDYKPRLAKAHGDKLPFALPTTEATVGMENTRLLGPVAPLRPRGRSGLVMSELLPNLANHADDLCVLRGMVSDSPNHPTAITFLHTGALNDLRPSLGAWLAYGLGTENQNLPGYITILPAEGERNYSSAFLPAICQGTPLQEVGNKPAQAPIRHLADLSLPPHLQRRRLDLIQTLNRRHLERLKVDQQMEGVIESFELAFRMQTETPKLVDLARESKATLELYGIGQAPTDRFGRQCLLARRFAEAGVRFIQVSLGGWDHHGKIRSALPESCAVADKPIAGLLTDLKVRGLLEDTLVLWSGEFGRTPHSQDLTLGKAPLAEFGREHNPHGFTAWLAGGGVKGGFAYGQTDEFAYRAIDGKVHIHDLHATILHLLGLHHDKLTYRHAGRDFRLTDVHGNVVREIIA
jgi:hypothetical protein